MRKTLHDYQVTALDRIVDRFMAGKNRILLQMATGTGKTVTFMSLLSHEHFSSWFAELPARSRRVLVVAHREEIIQQAAKTALEQNPGLSVGVEQGPSVASPYHDIIVASIQTLSARNGVRLARLMEPGHFGLVIIDECHHAAAQSYRTTLARLGFLPRSLDTGMGESDAVSWDDVETMERALREWDEQAPRDRMLLGVTATPNRSDTIGLGCVFQEIAYSFPIRQAVKEKKLVDIVPWVVENHTINLDHVKVTAGEFNQKQLAEAVNTQNRNTLAITAWHEHAKDRQTIAFCTSVQHAHDFARIATDAGVSTAVVHGETPREERRAIFQAYQRGEVTMLSNCMIATEGTDLPATSCILHLRPTLSSTLYEQMTGRGLRLAPGKDHCVVIDVVDIARRHRLNTAGTLAGLPVGLLVSGKPMTEIERELEDFRAKVPNLDLARLLENGSLTLEALKAKAVTFTMWDIQPLPADISKVAKLDWTRINDRDEYRVSYPWGDRKETLSITPDVLGHFCVVATSSSQWLTGEAKKQTTVSENHLTLVDAITSAEAYVAKERASAGRLVGGSASWKQKPASPGQIAFLRKLRVPFNPSELAKPGGSGQASKLIDMARARNARF